MTQREYRDGVGLFVLSLVFLSFFTFSFVHADPTGGTISGAVTETAPNQTPDSRTDGRGTITTMVLSTVQQDQHWKAYVGNVTGSLTLDDADNLTIYDWDLTGITGEVYASRFDNISWTSMACANATDINLESTFHNMTDADADDINSTFNWTIHKTFNIGSDTIPSNTCNSTVTYANDTRQVPDGNNPYQEVLIKDENHYLIYMTSIDDNSQGFDNESYDFQMIVAESNVKPTATSYYFYVELG